MSTERDELIRAIWSIEAEDHGTFTLGVKSEVATAIADAILAAGYRKQRTIDSDGDLFELVRASSMTVPDEAVEAAAKVLFAASPISRGHQPWGNAMGERIRKQFIADARAALTAAAPFIAAQAWEDALVAAEHHFRDLNPSEIHNPYRSGT